jgi:hypothetical protein
MVDNGAVVGHEEHAEDVGHRGLVVAHQLDNGTEKKVRRIRAVSIARFLRAEPSSAAS